MISLKIPETPYEMQILPGIMFTVRPLTSFDMNVATAEAHLAVQRLEKALDDVELAGLLPNRSIDMTNQAEIEAVFQAMLIRSLAERHIIAWTGITDDQGEPIDVHVKSARRFVVDLYPIGQVFYNLLTQKYRETLAAKKDCGTASNGTSSPAPVPDTAQSAKNPAPHAPAASRD